MSSSRVGPGWVVDHTVDCLGVTTTRTAVGSGQDRIAELEHQVENLTRALRGRDAIGQAKGILVAHYSISADEAFTLLIRVSQHHNTKLVEIASALLARIRERGPAQPRQCRRVVTELVEDLLAPTKPSAASQQPAGKTTSA